MKPKKSNKVVPDKKSKVYQREKINFNLNLAGPDWTEKQKEFIKLATDKNTRVIICKGVAGTGKSLLAMYCSLVKLNERNISEIYYTRVPVESSSYGIGFIKGEINDKMAPYLEPAMAKTRELLSESQGKMLLEDERIIGIPIGFLRGLSLDVCSMIGDEMQDATIQDLLLIMSRMGKHSKLFLLGDVQQCDIRNSGFATVYNTFDTEEDKNLGIHTFEFNSSDIMRSDILAHIINKFEIINSGIKKK